MKHFKLILFLSAIILFSTIRCKKNDSSLTSNIKYLGVIPSGCNTETKNFTVQESLNDTAWFSIKNDSLDIKVGFNATCCGSYKTSYLLKSDTILIDITATKIGSCNCICYYIFDFEFCGINKPYFFSINLDNYKTFRGKIDIE